MKFCSTCKISFEDSNFYKNPSKKDGLSHVCKKCWKIYRRNHYLENKQYYLKKARKYDRKIKNFYESLKNQKFCKVCKESDYRCLEFHHIDPKTKKFNISCYKGHSRKTLLEEIEKCIVLCSNCHKKEHKPH